MKQSQKAQWVDALVTQCRYASLPEPDTELRFHPTRRWRFDLGYPAQKLAVEVHGGVWANGRHVRGDGFTNDRRKMNEAQLLGWRVIEVTPEMIETGEALEYIERGLK